MTRTLAHFGTVILFLVGGPVAITGVGVLGVGWLEGLDRWLSAVLVVPLGLLVVGVFVLVYAVLGALMEALEPPINTPPTKDAG